MHNIYSILYSTVYNMKTEVKIVTELLIFFYKYIQFSEQEFSLDITYVDKLIKNKCPNINVEAL